MQSLESVCQSLHGFIDLKCKLKEVGSKLKRAPQASELALVTTEWSFIGTGPNDNPVMMATKSAYVLCQ